LATDTLFYLHTIPDVPDALPISSKLYLNGDFEVIRDYIVKGNPLRGSIRFSWAIRVGN
jgi:putative transcriptional regulator